MIINNPIFYVSIFGENISVQSATKNRLQINDFHLGVFKLTFLDAMETDSTRKVFAELFFSEGAKFFSQLNRTLKKIIQDVIEILKMHLESQSFEREGMHLSDVKIMTFLNKRFEIFF